jgi:DNA-binding beta-propeller fold protein YncE
MSTVAGNYAADQATGGLGGFSGDGGPATDAQLNSPQGVAVDRSGDLFIADTFNNALREVTRNGTITTVVNTTGKKGSSGNGGAATAAELNTPYAVAVDNTTGDAYVADTSNNRIRVVTGLPVPGWPAPGPGPTPPPQHH